MDFRYDRIKTMLSLLESKIVKSRMEVDGFLYKESDYKKGMPPKIDDSWEIFDRNKDTWGKYDGHAWFYKNIMIPTEMKGKNVRLSLLKEVPGAWVSIAPQNIVYVNGVLVQGADYNHSTIDLNGSEQYEVYSYNYSGMNDNKQSFYAELQEIDLNCEKLYYDIRVPFEVLEFLNPIDKNYIDILGHLNNAINLLDMRVVPGKMFDESVEKAIAYMHDEFYEKYCSKQDSTVVCIGHTHIDVAWLWTLDQTREKVQRSFATVISLMKKYPEYKFMSSQAQLYQFLKEESPETYNEVKRLVKEGRWEIEGSMWVEADCNLTSGESLVRQILKGKQFFKEEFGVDTKVLWLPDVFGYSAALPQILKKSGVDVFLTSKISWNETNQMPCDTFLWQGIDGTEIFSYFITAQDKKRGQAPDRFATYNADPTARQIAGTWDRYQQKEISDEVLMPFGYGDGGGGPNARQIEYIRRMEYGIPGCPNTKIEKSGEFFSKLMNNTLKNPRLPKWRGELYLEFHRGTYTSIAKNKKNNRQCEFLLLETELLSCMNNYLLKADYPKKQINESLMLILLNQFHDIIPGSSIKEVYEKSDEHYMQIRKSLNEISDINRKNIAANINTKGGLLVFNPHSYTNSGIVNINGKAVYVENIPSKGYKVVDMPEPKNRVYVSDKRIENDYFIVDFDDSYEIKRLYDKRNDREVIEFGKCANVITAYEDFPRDYDAWEITNYYKEKSWQVDNVSNAEIIYDGARSGIRISRTFLDSEIVQSIFLYDDIDKIDFKTEIDWKQEHILLKTAFPVNINSERATYDTQFGTVERPTHMNTSWDKAKFEVCAHKFADLAEFGYGVSLINDCKYGYDIHDNVMRLTLLKSATYPNPDADKGKHEFTYSLYPHSGDFREAKTIELAYDMNKPMYAMEIPTQNGTLNDEYSFIGCDSKNVIIETVKMAENGDDLIIRLYECANKRCNVKLKLGFKAKEAMLCDLMENALENLTISDNMVELGVKPYEIVTLKFGI